MIGEYLVKKFIRGGVSLAVLCLLVVFIYAQQATKNGPLSITPDTQPKLENNIIDIAILDNNLIAAPREVPAANDDKKDDKKLVKETASVRSTRRGASRGTFSATAYCLQGRTAMGHGVRRGIIAADPRILGLGSRVVIEGGGYSGTYLVSDTGTRVKGKKIDIWMPSCSEARRFGRRNVQIYSAL